MPADRDRQATPQEREGSAGAPGIGAGALADAVPAVDRGLLDALTAVGDRWSLALIAALLEGPLRFGALQEELPSISPSVLSQRLRALEARGLLMATPYSRRPMRYAYELTSAGRELGGVLRLLGDWGARHFGGPERGVPRHPACGTPLEVRWYCPACERPVDSPQGAPEDEELYFA